MPIWLTLVADIIKALLAGELRAWLNDRREAKAGQAIADAPITREELDERLKNHEF